MLKQLEKKIGKYAIKNLMLYVVMAYITGYVFALISKAMSVNIQAMITFEPYLILQGEVWRIFTWLLVPPQENPLFLAIMLLMYYQLGNALENTWGAFRFNVFIFGGCIFTMLAAFADYLILVYGMGYKPENTIGLGLFVTSYYVLLSIFLAFAVYFPDMMIMLYFIIPIKMKWMAVFYGVLIAYSVVEYLNAGAWYISLITVASVLNFVIFWLSTRKWKNNIPNSMKRRPNPNNDAPQQNSNIKFDRAGTPITRHRCSVCGRTEADAPELEFRYCSKCNGNFEYCSDHLFTHTHQI